MSNQLEPATQDAKTASTGPDANLSLSRQHLQTAATLAPTAANLHLLAQAEFMAGNWEAAEAACQRSLEAAHQEGEARKLDYKVLLLLAETQLRLKQDVAALKTATQAVKLEKTSEEGWLLLARAATAVGDKRRAIQSLEFYLLKIASQQLVGPLIYIMLARLYLETDKARQALDYMEQAQARLKAFYIKPGSSFLTLRARILLKLEETGQALDSYQQAIQLDPQNAALYDEMGQALFNQEQYEEALPAFRQALQLDTGGGGNADYHYHAGQAAYQAALRPNLFSKRRENLQQQAIQSFTRATQINPVFAPYWYELALAYAAVPNYKLMKLVLVQALAQSPAFSEDEASQVRYLRLYAKACQKLGDFKAAAQALQQILAILPDDHETLNELGDLSYRLASYNDAFNYFRRAEKLLPHHPRYLANLSRVMLKLERLEEAYELIDEAAQRDPHDYFVRFQLGAVLLEHDQAELALDHLREAASQEPDNAEFRYTLGRAYLQLGQVPEAIQEYQESLAQAPLQVQWHAELGEIYLRERLYLAALESFRLAAQLDPTDPDNHYNLAIALGCNGDILGAIRNLKEAQATPGLEVGAAWHYLMGRLLLELGRPGEALNSFARAHQLEPEDPYYKVDFARCLRLKGEPIDQIKPLLESAIAAAPDNWSSFEELAYLYEASNEPEAAMQALEAQLDTVLEAVRAL
jgi:tetratricopeptide (TPR) repeat protein